MLGRRVSHTSRALNRYHGSDSLTGFPDDLTSPPPAAAGPSASLPSIMRDPDLRAFFQALPKWSDMEALVLRLEETHRRDLHSVRVDVQLLSDRVSTGKMSLSLEHRVSQLAQIQSSQASQVTALQLHMQELEDQGVPYVADSEERSSFLCSARPC